MPDLLDPPMVNDPPVPDAVDTLLPRPFATWIRLVAGLLIVVSVAGIGLLWGQGYLSPRPDCCGGGSGSSNLALSADGEAVTITAHFFNSSGRDLTIRSASADLPGADVLDVQVLPDRPWQDYPVQDADDFPAPIAGRGDRLLLVTFVPVDCEATALPWGTVSLDLDVDNGWIPSVGGSHDVPVLEVADQLSPLPPASMSVDSTDPLRAACQLLDR